VTAELIIDRDRHGWEETSTRNGREVRSELETRCAPRSWRRLRKRFAARFLTKQGALDRMRARAAAVKPNLSTGAFRSKERL